MPLSYWMQIKDIEQFLGWCLAGRKTLQKRRDMFYERKEMVIKQMEELQKTLEVIQYKCWYYETACEAGTEDVLRNMSINDLPKDVRKGRAALEKSLSD